MSEVRIHNLNKLLLSEVLQMINEDTSLLDQGKPFGFQHNSALHKVFYYGFVPAARFILPEGIPPYTPSNMRAGANAVDLLIAIRRGRFSYFVDKNIPNARREQLFIGLLETVYQEEAKILLAIKDQNLTTLFPNITYKRLFEAGYLPYDPVQCGDQTKSDEHVQQTEVQVEPMEVPQVQSVQTDSQTVPVRRGRGRPRGSKNKKKLLELHAE